MTAAELVNHQSAAQADMADRVYYAQTLAASGMLPSEYRGNPANVLYAVEYGRALGLEPVVAMNAISVIEGKPSASAGLVSALVRRAGHRLRVITDETAMSATVEIVRSDDSGFTFTATWDLARAEGSGLVQLKDGKPYARSKNGNPLPWERFPMALLIARATTECARKACQEALFGLQYTPEELGAVVDQDGVAVAEARPIRVVNQPGASIRDAAEAIREPVDATGQPYADAEVVEDAAANLPEALIDKAGLTRLHAALGEFGVGKGLKADEARAAKLNYCAGVVDHPLASSADITVAESVQIMHSIRSDIADMLNVRIAERAEAQP